MIVTIIGSLAAAMSVISFAPQAWRIIKTRETKGLSPKMYSLTTIGFALWSTYGVLKGEWPIIVPNVLCFCFAVFILSMIVLPAKKRNAIADTLDPDVS